jgi:plastocyanin
MFPRRFIALLVLALLAALSACSRSTPSQAPGPTPTTPTSGNTQEIVMQNRTFVPAKITIKAGTVVRWTNQDSYAHTVVSGTRDKPTPLFSSGSVGAGQSFSFTFKDPGVYPYFCTPHQGMDGEITVQ